MNADPGPSEMCDPILFDMNRRVRFPSDPNPWPRFRLFRWLPR